MSMKKKALAILFVILSFNSFSQDILPTYPQVLRHFFSNYVGLQENENFTSFAKKIDGWYVQQVDRYHSDSLLDATLIWSLQENRYLDISLKYQKNPLQNSDSLTQSYLTDIFLVYGFERCIYFGYNGWDENVINDLENVQTLCETSLESLARAYVSVSNKYLWHQYGEFVTGYDSLKRRLLPTDLPSEQRVEKVNYFMQKSIDTYKRIAQQNPNYVTLVGDIGLKIFNEAMHGYSQMNMCLKKEEADLFFSKITIKQPHIDQAKNYLNSCDSNAILFTYGDNDTYQLWYVQQKENFRKDISVINTSLLGLPIYIEMLKKNKEVIITTPTSFYKKYGSEVSYYEEKKNVECGEYVLLDALEKVIYSHKFPMESNTTIYKVNDTISTYPCKYCVIPINHNCNFKSKSVLKNATHDIEINLKSYLFLSDLVLLNIVKNNIKKRPVYFTSKPTEYFSDATLTQGLLEKLVNPALVNEEGMGDFVEKNMELFLKNMYKPALSNDTTKSFDGDNSFAVMYTNIVSYYVAKNDFVSAKKWAKKALSQIRDINKLTTYAIGTLASMHLAAKEYLTAKQLYMLHLKKVTNNYFVPKGIETYKTKANCLVLLQAVKQIFNHEEIEVEEVDLLISKLKKE